MLTIAMWGMAAVGGCLLVAGYRQQRSAWDMTTTFVLAVAAVVSSASLIAIIQGRYVVVFDAVHVVNVRVLQSAYSPLYGYLIAAGVVGSLWLFLMRWRARGPVVLPAVLALALSVVMTLANPWHGPFPQVTFGAAFMMAALLAATQLTPGRGAWLGAGMFMLTLGTASAVFTAVRPQDGARVCDGAKCGGLDALVQGVTASENALGLAVALALPFAWFAFDGRLRLAVVTYGILWVWLTGSRTSLVAVAAFLVGLLILRIGVRQFATAALLVAAAVGLLLPRQGSIDPGSLSLRGRLWEIAFDRMPHAQWTGFGSEAWGQLYTQAGAIRAGAIYSPHNQWLEIQYAAGVVGLLVYGAWLASVMYAGRFDMCRTAVLLLPALVMGITERAWSFGLPDWLTWALVALCLAAPTFRSGEVSDDDDLSVAAVPTGTGRLTIAGTTTATAAAARVGAVATRATRHRHTASPT